MTKKQKLLIKQHYEKVKRIMKKYKGDFYIKKDGTKVFVI